MWWSRNSWLRERRPGVPKGPRRESGFTIIEVLVFATILLLLMGSIVMVLQSGLRYLRLGAAYQDAHRETLLGMHTMVEGLRRGNAFHLFPNPLPIDDGSGNGSDFIIFMSPEQEELAEDWTYRGTNLEYYHWLSYFYDSGRQEVFEARLPIDGAPVVTLDFPDFPNLSDFRPPGNRDARAISRGVSRLSFTQGGSSQQIRIRLECSVPTGTNTYTRVTSQSLVLMPNR